jgi:hypothetical protein
MPKYYSILARKVNAIFDRTETTPHVYTAHS